MSEIKYYPLTIPQQILYMEQKYSLNKAIVNICTMLTFDTDMDTRLLMQSCYLAMLRNESSAVRLHKQENKEIVSYLSDESPEKIEVCDYTGRTEAEFLEDVHKWSHTVFPSSSMDCQLYRIKLIYKPDYKTALYFCVSHLAFDAYALMAIANDMIKIYVALRDHQPIPTYKGNYLKMCEQDWIYQKSEEHAADLKFWEEEVFPDEPLYSPPNAQKMKRKKGKRYGPATNLLHSSAKQFNRRMPADLCQKVNEAAARFHVSPHVYYMLALRAHLSSENENAENIQINSTVARRATLLEKNSGGTRVLAFPFNMNMSNKLTVEDALKEMTIRQKHLYPHANVLLTDITDYFARQWKKGPFDDYASATITFNPYTLQLPDGIEAHLETFCNGATAMALYLTIMAQDNSGCLNFNYECMNIYTDESTVDRTHARMKHALEIMVENPQATLADLNS